MSLRGITELLGQGLRRAGLVAADVGYCELHALGTPIVDAVELAAFCRVCHDARRPHARASDQEIVAERGELDHKPELLVIFYLSMVFRRPAL